MKLILTEEQAHKILFKEEYGNQITDLINEGISIKDLRQYINYALTAGVAATSIILAINKSNIPDTDKEALAKIVYSMPKTDSLRNQKLEEINNFIKFSVGTQGKTLNDCQVNAEDFLNASETYGFDIKFLLAVAHVESHFGITPRAKRTNSIFSVGCYTDGTDKTFYQSQKESIPKYINLIQNKYLVNGKTYDDLLKKGGFVNGIGNRYASDLNYESTIKSTINRINKMCPNLS